MNSFSYSEDEEQFYEHGTKRQYSGHQCTEKKSYIYSTHKYKTQAIYNKCQLTSWSSIWYF